MRWKKVRVLTRAFPKCFLLRLTHALFVMTAHPDVFNIMLQMLDDGRLTDAKGNTVNFRNTICIFTSNIGSADILDLNGSSEEGDQEIMRERVTQAMRDFFKPEFLNRIDEHVIFNSLGKNDLRGIVRIEAQKLAKRLEERQISLTLTDAAMDYLADVGFDPVYGARPLKRTIQRELETNVARRILSGEIKDKDTVIIDMKNGSLSIEPVGHFVDETVDSALTSSGFE
jgi:ATP-dependent Clp protease ATP-binding subunit ClpB